MTPEIFCFYLQNRLIQTSQTRGQQQYSDTSPFSIPCLLALATLSGATEKEMTLIGNDIAGIFAYKSRQFK
jgi:hypothetical protein